MGMPVPGMLNPMMMMGGMGMMNPMMMNPMMMMGGMGGMGGLYPMGSGLPMNGVNKKPIVVVHSKNGKAKVETKMVDDETANKIRKNGASVQQQQQQQQQKDTQSGPTNPKPTIKKKKKPMIKKQKKKLKYGINKFRGPKKRKRRKRPKYGTRRLLSMDHNDDSDDNDDMQIEYKYNTANIKMIKKCKIWNENEICINYDLDSMQFSFDSKHISNKVLRENDGKLLIRNAINSLSVNKNNVYDENILNNDNMLRDDNVIYFEPIKGNLGYAIFKYELMNWHYIPSLDSNNNNYKYHQYGQFKNFVDFAHYFNEMDFIYDPKDKCSQTLNNLQYKLCIHVFDDDDDDDDDIILYFEKDDNQYIDNLDFELNYPLKKYIDDQFENTVLYFNKNNDWNEINKINNNNNKDMIIIEKCSYLLTSKICINKNSETIKASISHQLGNTQN